MSNARAAINRLHHQIEREWKLAWGRWDFLKHAVADEIHPAILVKATQFISRDILPGSGEEVGINIVNDKYEWALPLARWWDYATKVESACFDKFNRKDLTRWPSDFGSSRYEDTDYDEVALLSRTPDFRGEYFGFLALILKIAQRWEQVQK